METEARLLADVYGLLLADIRRNRARRLAAQAHIRISAAEQIDSETVLSFGLSGAEPTKGGSLEQTDADHADNESAQSH